MKGDRLTLNGESAFGIKQCFALQSPPPPAVCLVTENINRVAVSTRYIACSRRVFFLFGFILVDRNCRASSHFALYKILEGRTLSASLVLYSIAVVLLTASLVNITVASDLIVFTKN